MKKNKTTEKSTVMKYEGNNITFNLTGEDVMINVTEFAKAFPDKNLSTIINSLEIREYIKKLTELKNFSSADLLTVKKGGKVNEQGTWANKRVALRIAQKLSTDFSIWVDMQIEELLTKGSVSSTKKAVSQTSTGVKDGVLYMQKLDTVMIHGINYNGISYFNGSTITDYFNFSSGAAFYAKKMSDTCYVKQPMGKNHRYFFNKEGIDELLILSRQEVSSLRVNALYNDLFQLSMAGNKLPDLEYPYQFTHQDINDLLFEISKIGKLGLQNKITGIIRGGRV